MKYVILQGDGMPDHPLPELGGKTPLEAARTPNLDRIAKSAIKFGMVKTIPDDLPPGSDVGNLTVLGYNPHLYYTGRSPSKPRASGCHSVTGTSRSGATSSHSRLKTAASSWRTTARGISRRKRPAR